MFTNATFNTKPATQSVEAILKIMELAQQRNIQPKQTKYTLLSNRAATACLPVPQSVEGILKMMEMAQRRYLQQS